MEGGAKRLIESGKPGGYMKGVSEGGGKFVRILSFWVRPDFDCTIRAGGDHLSGFDGVVLGPGDYLIVNPRRRVRLQDGRLISSSSSTRKTRQLESGPGGNGPSFKEKLECSRQGGPKPRQHRFRLRR